MNLPPKNNQFVIGIVLILGLLGTYFLSMRPAQLKEWKKAERSLKSARSKLQKLEKEVDEKELASMRRVYSEMEKHIVDLGEKLLSKEHLLRFLDELAGVVEDNEIKLDFIQLKQLPFRTEDIETGKGKVLKAESFPVEIRLRGESREFASYMWVLERFPQLIKVEKISLARSMDSNLELIMTVVVPAGLTESGGDS